MAPMANFWPSSGSPPNDPLPSPVATPLSKHVTFSSVDDVLPTQTEVSLKDVRPKVEWNADEVRDVLAVFRNFGTMEQMRMAC